MESGVDWEGEVCTDVCPERNIRLHFQARDAPSWMLERRHAVARGIHYRLHGNGRFVDTAASNEIQYCVITMLNHGGFPRLSACVRAQSRGFVPLGGQRP